jgi:hypothetical protein
VVTVNNPPLTGYHTSKGYVEVIVTQPNPTFFMGLFGFGSVNVAARAVAGTGGPGPACIDTLGGVGITGAGSGGISVPSCNIDDNGGITLSGSDSIVANKVNMVGQYTHSGSASVTPAPVASSAMSDPLASLPQPTVPSSGCAGVQVNPTAALTPGCYNGIVLSGSAKLNLNPGLYIINGGISYSGSPTINGTGVTLFMTGGLSGSGSLGLNLIAPTSGTYDGIALFLSRSDSSGLTISGSNGMNFQGIIYAPDSNLTLSGSSAINLVSDIIVKNITFSGSTTIQNYTSINTSTLLGSGSGNGTFALVE